MEIKTNLRALRHRHRISAKTLAVHAGLSRQYVSCVELGKIAATPRLERQMADAIASVISARRAEVRALEDDYAACKGRLLREEEHPSEQ